MTCGQYQYVENKLHATKPFAALKRLTVLRRQWPYHSIGINSRATRRCNTAPHHYAVYWLRTS